MRCAFIMRSAVDPVARTRRIAPPAGCAAARPAARHRTGALRRPAVLLRAGSDRTPQFVPADGFGGERPETKGAAALSRLFTYAAIRIVQAQLEGLGNDGGFAPQATGAGGDVEAPPYDALRRAMEQIPLGDGDSWLEALLAVDAALAVRIMGVRAAYASDDFDFVALKALTQRRIEEGNTRLMRAHVEQTAGGGGAGGVSEAQA